MSNLTTIKISITSKPPHQYSRAQLVLNIIESLYYLISLVLQFKWDLIPLPHPTYFLPYHYLRINQNNYTKQNGVCMYVQMRLKISLNTRLIGLHHGFKLFSCEGRKFGATLHKTPLVAKRLVLFYSKFCVFDCRSHL